MRKAVLAILCVVLCAPLLAATLANVTLPDSTTVGNQTLVLNGLGLRSKMMFKVYVAGLYLEKKSNDANAIIQGDTTKRIVLHFVRDVSKEQMTEAFSDSLKANAPDKAASLKSQIDQFLGAMEPMKSGEEFSVTYVPATGTTLAMRGKDKVTIPGLPFGQTIFAMWLGPKPPNEDLKNGLLGKK
jgi:hypothetical protein